MALFEGDDLGTQGFEHQGFEHQGFEHQGFEHQGFEHQGFEHQGFEHQGVDLRGFQLQSFAIQGQVLQSVALNGTLFTGTRPSGGTVTGAAFTGATVNAIFSDGSPLTVRIDAIEASETDPDVYLYTLSWTDGAQWKSLCGDVDGRPVTAVPLAGRWDLTQGTPTGGDHVADPSLFTFGCSSAVLAKCVHLGYKPWESVEECASGGAPCQQISQRHLHQACTRMMRADVCGDGMPHTANGTVINLWDNHGIQTQEETAWSLEAEWTPGGAKCVNHVRWTSGGRTGVEETEGYIAAHCPEVRSALALTTCGTYMSTFFIAWGYSAEPQHRVLLRNESESPPAP